MTTISYKIVFETGVHVEGPNQHPSCALFYLFDLARSTGVSNPNMCPHCVVQDLTRLHSSDSVVLVARPQYGSWQNARLLANDGRFLRNGNRGFIRCNNFDDLSKEPVQNLVSALAGLQRRVDKADAIVEQKEEEKAIIVVVKHSSKAKQLHRGTNDIVWYKETKWAAECAKAQAEAELSNAKQTVKDLFSMIGESMYKAKAEMRDMAPLKKYVKPRNDDNQYSQVMTELEHAKRELFQLKLHVGSVLEEKLQAENEVKASRSSMLSFSRVAQKQTNEIEEANEEQLVVQLDRMDALNELRDIEQLQNTRNKLKEAIQAIDETKELEMKLATTLSDIDMLKNDFKFVNKMGKSYKLLRAKSKLEVVSAAEEKAKSIVSNLTQTLDKLKSKTEAAKKEKDLIINGEELQAVKSSEALALEKLKILRENAMKDRISNVTKPSSLIIISKFQYDYSRNQAGKANEIAEKNKLREQLVFDTLRGDWKVAFGIWEFDPLKLNALSTTKRRQLSMRNLQCASSTPTIFTTRGPQGSWVTAFWGEVEFLGFQLGHSGVDWLGFENVRNYIQGVHAGDENSNQNTKMVYSATCR
ncbi:Protein PLASTID MOVEMENT IMPAIRED 2 [Glycine soja]|uniref:Protein PLASTID MOVEMENT IMPAIRED 2 n=1 Tax=Glycine soja TaxID=3848 RepID=A0A0B2PIQ5_GLYSO|nr:Protein PLASTID MOVEMENT IMPAIRED 2 [Glycine soja]